MQKFRRLKNLSTFFFALVQRTKNHPRIGNGNGNASDTEKTEREGDELIEKYALLYRNAFFLFCIIIIVIVVAVCNLLYPVLVLYSSKYLLARWDCAAPSMCKRMYKNGVRVCEYEF